MKMSRIILFAVMYTLLVSLLSVMICHIYYKKRFCPELTLERLNIVDPQGNLRMVFSNEQRQHPGTIDGVELENREREPGIIFFNSSGDECGGLVFDGNDELAGFVLSIDGYKNDQLMQLQYLENTETKEQKYGLMLWEYPKGFAFSQAYPRIKEILKDPGIENKAEVLKREKLLAENRLFIGRQFDGTYGLFINDSQGNARVKLYVDNNDEPRFEITAD